jgi:hypothetical protein
LFAVAFERERFERTARNVTASNCEAFSDIIGNAPDDFHQLSLA